MYIALNRTQNCQIQRVSHECITITKNYVISTTNKILKCAPLINALIGIGVIFLLAYQTEGHVLLDTITTAAAPELDDVIKVPVNNLPSSFSICTYHGPLCRIILDSYEDE